MQDTRGVSTIIGAVFVFGFLVIAISINQVQVVPAENAQVEATHNQEVRDDLIAARTAIIEASYPQRDGTVSVALGTRYPARTIGLNPPPATGRVATTANETLVVKDASNTRVDVCAGNPNTDNTRRLRYQPNYNEYNGPTTVYENTFVYNQQESGGSFGEARLTETALAFNSSDNAGTINLIALRNDYTANGVDSTSVDFVSGETNRSSGIQDPTITLPTGVTNQAIWQEIVNEIDAKSGISVTIDNFNSGSSVRIAFTGKYDILCTPVGVGGDPPSGPATLVPPSSGGGGGGGGGGADTNTRLVNGSKGPNDDIVAFDLENTGSSSVTISEIKVESTSKSKATKVKWDGGATEFKRTNGSGKLDQTLDIDPNTSPVPLNTTATIGAGNAAPFELGQFKQDDGSFIDMSSGEEITIIIVFDDGTEERYSFTT